MNNSFCCKIKLKRSQAFDYCKASLKWVVSFFSLFAPCFVQAATLQSIHHGEGSIRDISASQVFAGRIALPISNAHPLSPKISQPSKLQVSGLEIAPQTQPQEGESSVFHGFGSATAISNDGRTTVGYRQTETGIEAFKWDAQGLRLLGDLDGGAHESVAYDISDHGEIIVGRGTDEQGYQAIIWHESIGMQPLSEVLSTLGKEVWVDDQLTAKKVQTRLIAVDAISAGGNVLIGRGLLVHQDASLEEQSPASASRSPQEGGSPFIWRLNISDKEWQHVMLSFNDSRKLIGLENLEKPANVETLDNQSEGRASPLVMPAPVLNPEALVINSASVAEPESLPSKDQIQSREAQSNKNASTEQGHTDSKVAPLNIINMEAQSRGVEAGISRDFSQKATQKNDAVLILSPEPNAVYKEGDYIKFIASGSQANKIQWRSNIDGILGSGKAGQTLLSPGAHEITASWQDDQRKLHKMTVAIRIEMLSNETPLLRIDRPKSGWVFQLDQMPIELTGKALDPEEGNISKKIQWYKKNTLLGKGEKVAFELPKGTHQLRVIVSDNGGKQQETMLKLVVKAPSKKVKLVKKETVTKIAEQKKPVTTVAPKKQSSSAEKNQTSVVTQKIQKNKPLEAVDVNQPIKQDALEPLRKEQVAVEKEVKAVDQTAKQGASSGTIAKNQATRNQATQSQGQNEVLADLNSLPIEPLAAPLDISIDSDAPITSGVILSSSSSKVQQGRKVEFVAKAHGGSGEYEFLIRVKGGKQLTEWKILRQWSSSSKFVLDTKKMKGDYRVEVQARNQGTQDKPVKDRIKLRVEY